MKTLFFIPIFLFFVNISFSQNVVNFVEEGVEFNLYLNGEFTYKVPNGVSKTTKNYNGQISSVGTVKITYDFSQRISKIGSVAIRFNFTNQIIQVGGLTINYDINGNLSSTSGQVNSPTNTNINSQAGNTNTQNQQTQSTRQTTTQSSEEKEVIVEKKENTEFDELIRRAKLEMSDTLKMYHKLKKPIDIPNGYHTVQVIITNTYGVGTLINNQTVYVANNQIIFFIYGYDNDVSYLYGESVNNRITEMVKPLGEISLGKGYFERQKLIISKNTDVYPSKDKYEVYFLDYLRNEKIADYPYRTEGRVDFDSESKEVSSGKAEFWLFAKPLNNEDSDYLPIGVVRQKQFCTLLARPDTYTIYGMVISIKKGIRSLSHTFTANVTLKPNDIQKKNLTP